MTIEIGRYFKVDDQEVYIVATDCGSAKEALAEVEAAAEELGAAPYSPVTGKTGPAAAPAKQKRRTKAEMEADAAKVVPPELPPNVARAFSPPLSPTSLPSAGPPAVPPTTPYPGPAPATFSEPTVALSEAPPVPLGQSSVTISAPPPAFSAPPQAPMLSGEEMARAELNTAVSDLLGSVPATWLASVQGTASGIVARHGGPIEAMTEDQARTALRIVQDYRRTCDAAPR